MLELTAKKQNIACKTSTQVSYTLFASDYKYSVGYLAVNPDKNKAVVFNVSRRDIALNMETIEGTIAEIPTLLAKVRETYEAALAKAEEHGEKMRQFVRAEGLPVVHWRDRYTDENTRCIIKTNFLGEFLDYAVNIECSAAEALALLDHPNVVATCEGSLIRRDGKDEFSRGYLSWFGNHSRLNIGCGADPRSNPICHIENSKKMAEWNK